MQSNSQYVSGDV